VPTSFQVMTNEKMSKEWISKVMKTNGIFWIRTPTALVMRNTITPKEYYQVERIEHGDSSMGKVIDIINEQHQK